MNFDEKVTVAEAVMAGADLHLLEVAQKIKANLEEALGASEKDRDKLFLSLPLELLYVFNSLSNEEQACMIRNMMKVFTFDR